jgi:hypothetical protein
MGDLTVRATARKQIAGKHKSSQKTTTEKTPKTQCPNAQRSVALSHTQKQQADEGRLADHPHTENKPTEGPLAHYPRRGEITTRKRPAHSPPRQGKQQADKGPSN